MSDDYLVMARVLAREWDKWREENMRPDDIGHTILRAKDAYKDAFMKGFYLKLTKGDE